MAANDPTHVGLNYEAPGDIWHIGGTLEFGPGAVITNDSGTAVAIAGAATLSKGQGVVTSEALTTAGLAAYTLTLTNTIVAATSVVMAAVANGTNTQGVPVVGRVTPGAGSVTIEVRNVHATQALNGTLVVSFIVRN
jgi:hypothetical protein